jgi:hypothetical protein
MNHKQLFTRGIMLVLAILLTACATPTATSCPTTVPQSCPTVAAQAMPEMNAFRSNLSGMANVIFTFDPGDKCSMQIISKTYTAEFIYEIVVNDQSHLNYMVVGMTLNPGHTIAEVEEYNRVNPNTKEPPPMMTMQLYNAVNPMSSTWNIVTYTGDPIYFSCLTEGPDEHQVIASFDPLVMPTK